MRCALASMGFVNEDVMHNKGVIISTMMKYARDADIVIFGEAFLQGFYGANFDAVHDAMLAVSAEDAIIHDICAAAKAWGVAVSFGFIEKDGGCFYSSQMTIDPTGRIIDLYRRVSPGWKEAFAGKEYREGDGFHTFSFLGRNISVGLCGDLWFDEHISRIRALQPDIVFWPVYTDYNCHEWNTSVKHEYAAQAGKVGERVLYVNSCCKDRQGEEIARGGSACFAGGRIEKELPAGQEGVLLVEV